MLAEQEIEECVATRTLLRKTTHLILILIGLKKKTGIINLLKS